MSKIPQENRARKEVAREGFICIDANGGGFCDHLHATIRESQVCNTVRYEAAAQAGKVWDSSPHRAHLVGAGRGVLAYSEARATDAIIADPCLNGGPDRDHDADRKTVFDSVAPELVAAFRAEALKFFPPKAKEARRARRSSRRGTARAG